MSSGNRQFSLGSGYYVQPVVNAVQALPLDVTAAAQARGRERDLWETAAELLGEFCPGESGDR